MSRRSLHALVVAILACGGVFAQETTNGNLRPNVAWVAPGTAPYVPWATIPLEVTASDPDGFVSHVVFWYQDGTKARIIADVAAPPYKTNWRSVAPGVYTVYALALDNKNLGQNTPALTIVVGRPPVITTFSASPDGVATPTTPATLRWSTTGASTLVIDQGVGTVTGRTSTVAVPNAPSGSTSVFTLTATNVYGTTTATTDVTVGLPVITRFIADTPTITAQGATLTWSTGAARTVQLTPAPGPVAATGSVSVFPATTKTQGSVFYQLTASNAMGTTTKVLNLGQMATLTKLTDTLYYSEHVLFLIPSAGQVNWSGNSYNDVYSAANRSSYIATLTQYFPDDYVYVPLIARNLSPSFAPSALTFRHLADGIGDVNVTGIGVPNFTRYPVTGTFLPASLGVLTHEAGHNWGVRIGAEVGIGHWLWNSTALGQMADVYTDDGYQTVKQIQGAPAAGFTWSSLSNVTRNQTQTYNDQDLYLMGLNDTFPAVHVLKAPIFNADHTVSYTSVATYDQAWVENRWGVRSPSYASSPKRLRAAFIYIARDLTELLTVAPNVELAAEQWSEGERLDTVRFNMQVPFLVATKYRASFNARLADLDGNVSPTLAIEGPSYIVSHDGSAQVPFVAIDPDGFNPPTVSCVPASAGCTTAGSVVTLSGLAPGAHFLTIKAQDPGGKKAFAHVVVDVK